MRRRDENIVAVVRLDAYREAVNAARFLPERAQGSRDPEGTTGVTEVCSASDCISQPPEDWEKRWDFNRACCYAGPAEAAASIPVGQRAEYAVFAYWLLPGSADPSKMFDARLPPLPAGDGPTDYDVLGFDVVEMEPDTSAGPSRLPPFGHAPLSCNYLAREIPVNKYCLVDCWRSPRTAEI